jgi:hypothetical protein
VKLALRLEHLLQLCVHLGKLGGERLHLLGGVARLRLGLVQKPEAGEDGGAAQEAPC